MNILAAICILSVTPLTQAGWKPCNVRSGGPGSNRVAEAVGYLTNAFGAGDNNIPQGTARTVICNGLALSVVNSAGYDQADTPELRQKMIDSAGDIGDGFGCLWKDNEKDSFDLGYIFTKGSDVAQPCGAGGGQDACCNKGCNGEVLSGEGAGCK